MKIRMKFYLAIALGVVFTKSIHSMAPQHTTPLRQPVLRSLFTPPPLSSRVAVADTSPDMQPTATAPGMPMHQGARRPFQRDLFPPLESTTPSGGEIE
jgi:hypothetical protein